MKIKRPKILIIIFTIILSSGLLIWNTYILSYRDVEGEKVKAPSDWFFRQRAFPSGEINYEAYKVAYHKSQLAKQQPSSRWSTAMWEFAGPLNRTDKRTCRQGLERVLSKTQTNVKNGP